MTPPASALTTESVHPLHSTHKARSRCRSRNTSSSSHSPPIDTSRPITASHKHSRSRPRSQCVYHSKAKVAIHLKTPENHSRTAHDSAPMHTISGGFRGARRVEHAHRRHSFTIFCPFSGAAARTWQRAISFYVWEGPPPSRYCGSARAALYQATTARSETVPQSRLTLVLFSPSPQGLDGVESHLIRVYLFSPFHRRLPRTTTLSHNTLVHITRQEEEQGLEEPIGAQTRGQAQARTTKSARRILYHEA